MELQYFPSQAFVLRQATERTIFLSMEANFHYLPLCDPVETYNQPPTPEISLARERHRLPILRLVPIYSLCCFAPPRRIYIFFFLLPWVLYLCGWILPHPSLVEAHSSWVCFFSLFHIEGCIHWFFCSFLFFFFQGYRCTVGRQAPLTKIHVFFVPAAIP